MSADTPVRNTGHQPVFKMFNMILFAVCAIMLLSQFMLTASIGPTSIFWTIVIIVLFFIPYGLVTSELGAAYPDDGGIYSWVQRAFGRKWGTRVSFWYWVNVALWVPSVYVIFASTVTSIFFPDVELNLWIQIAVALVLIWINYWINTRTLQVGSWVANAGAGITMVVTVILAGVAIAYGIHNGSATDWSLPNLLPTGNAFSAVALALPIIIYNFLGFELMSSASGEMRNPQRDVPRTILVAGILIGVFYLIATISMQVIAPAEDISLTSGLIDVLRTGLGSSATAVVVLTILGIGALYCFFAVLIPWTIGANLAASEASQRGDLPKVFGIVHPTRKTPTGAALLTAIIGTAITLIYGVLSSLTQGSIDTVFWNLFYLSSAIFLLPYVVLMLVFLKLRKSDPDAHRPYKVPGSSGFLTVMAWVPLIMLVFSVLFFILNPFSFDWSWTAPVLIGFVVALAIGEVMVRIAPKWIGQWGRDADPELEPVAEAGK